MPTSDAAGKISRRDLAATLLVLVGFALIALSFVWPKVATGSGGWSEAEALAYQAASEEVHRLSMQMAAREPEQQTRAHHEQLADARSDYAELRAQLDAARSRPDRIAMFLRYAGVLLLVAGVLGLVVNFGRDSAAA